MALRRLRVLGIRLRGFAEKPAKEDPPIWLLGLSSQLFKQTVLISSSLLQIL